MGKINYAVHHRLKNGAAHPDRLHRKRSELSRNSKLYNLSKSLPQPLRRCLHSFERHLLSILGGPTYYLLVILGVGIAVLSSSSFVFRYIHDTLEAKKAVTFLSTSLKIPPLTAPLGERDAQSNASLFWGSYRPNVYFGIRHRSPQSLLAGLMWFKQDDMNLNIRHVCDSLHGVKYNWLKHDGRTFGEEEIIDGQIKLSASFLKRPHGRYGGDWTAKIRFQSTKINPDIGGSSSPVSILFYFYLPHISDAILTPITSGSELVGIDGRTEELGRFRIQFLRSTSNVHHITYLSTAAPREDLIEKAITQGMGFMQSEKTHNRRHIGLIGTNKEVQRANLLCFEMTVSDETELTILYQSVSENDQNNPLHLLDGEIWNNLWKKNRDEFEEKFEKVFHLRQQNYSHEEIEQGQMVLSNVLGGIGYFYGHSLISSMKSGPDPIAYGPGSLFTATPSRSVFPRGFLWDEGFHQLVIQKWDLDLSIQCISSWLELMNANGWICREQILGWEARSKVPEKFIIQNDTSGNPPTLILPLMAALEHRTSELEPFREKLQRMLPYLEKWFNWFNTTQLGKYPASYRWHGRNPDEKHQLNPLTLTSGLDDYPRASHPTDNERHLDLRCWIAIFSKFLSRLHQFCGSDLKSYEMYEKWYQKLSDEELLSVLHWDESDQQFSDYGLHSEDVHLIHPQLPVGAQPKTSIDMSKIRYVRTPPKERYLPTRGYVNLFPLMLKLLPANSKKLAIILKDLRNTSLLWTQYGLRSLSRVDKFYQKHNTENDPPYWRGAIWINMNYLTFQALKYYAENFSLPLAKELQQRLRHNVVKTVLGELKRTKFLWEQYHDEDGRGHRAKPFSGWSSLVLLMMANE